MAFSPAFSVSQNIGANSILIFQDTSSGSNPFITERHIYLRKSDGTFLVPEGNTTDYIVWPLSTNPFSVDVLDKDYALSIVVEWNNDGSIPSNGMWAWYLGSIGVTGTDEVTDWADQSGNQYDLTTTTFVFPELVEDVINSLPAVSSYGVLATMATVVNLANLSAGGTVFIVAKQSVVNGATGSDAAGVFLGAGNETNMQIQRGSTSISGNVFSVSGGIDASTLAITTPVIPDDTFVTIRLKNDGTDNTIAVNNGTVGTATADGSGYSATPLTVFSSLGGANGNKQIAEIIIYNRALSGSEVTEVETYLQDKYQHY